MGTYFNEAGIYNKVIDTPSYGETSIATSPNAWYGVIPLNSGRTITVKNPEDSSKNFTIDYLPRGATFELPRADYNSDLYKGYNNADGSSGTSVNNYNLLVEDSVHNSKFVLRFSAYYNGSSTNRYYFVVLNAMRVPFYDPSYSSTKNYYDGMVVKSDSKYYKGVYTGGSLSGKSLTNTSYWKEVSAPTGELTTIKWNENKISYVSQAILYKDSYNGEIFFHPNTSGSLYHYNDIAYGTHYLPVDGASTYGSLWVPTADNKWQKALVGKGSADGLGGVSSAYNWYVTEQRAWNIIQNGVCTFPSSRYKHTVKFDNGLSGDANYILTQTKTPHDGKIMPTQTGNFARNGYVLVKWVNAEDSSDEWVPGAVYTRNFLESQAKTVTYIAVWKSLSNCRVYTNNAWKLATPYTFIGGSWKRTPSKIWKDSDWKT